MNQSYKVHKNVSHIWLLFNVQGSEPLLLIGPCSVSISKAYIFREGSKNLKKMGDFFKSWGVHRVDKLFTPTYESNQNKKPWSNKYSTRYLDVVWDHQFKRSANYYFFDPYPPTVGSFLVLSVGKIWQIFYPSPPRAYRRLKWMVPFLHRLD